MIFSSSNGNVLTPLVKLTWELNNSSECILKWYLEVKFCVIESLILGF